MSKIGAFFRLTRIEHSFMLVIAVIAAELISGGIPSVAKLALSIIVPIFISMASFSINDYFDVGSDKANKRTDRPIVSGEISKKSALAISLVCLFIGIISSVFINLYAFFIALIFGALAMLYSYRMKDMVLLGNVYIGLSMAIPFIFGDFVESTHLYTSIIIISIIIFLSGVAREVHGMIRDYKGDMKARKTRNLLYHTEKERAAQFAFILYLEAILLSIFLFFFETPFKFNLVYIVPIAITDFILAYISIKYMFSRRTDFYRMSRNASLVAMGIALIAFLISPIFYVLV